MTTVITFSTITQPEVVHLLTAAFGPVRSWSDFLADCIRGRGSKFYGLALEPICYMPGTGGRSKRPLYSCRDVRAFIMAARERGASTVRHRPEVYLVELTADQLRLPPSIRRPGRVATH